MCPYVYLFDFNGTAGQATSIMHVDIFLSIFFCLRPNGFCVFRKLTLSFLFCLPFYQSALAQDKYRIIDDGTLNNDQGARKLFDLIDLCQI